MPTSAKNRYELLDVPRVLRVLFHPRPAYDQSGAGADSNQLMIPVAPDVEIGAAFYPAGPGAPTILFFHGNGEIVEDYEDLGPVYGRLGINFLPVDYRGYGRSTGEPTVAAMLTDCHKIFEFARTWLRDNQYTGPLLVMGRSLGSASALEIGARYPDLLQGLIIESGFALIAPLLELIGADPASLGLTDDPVGNLEKIKLCRQPTLIIHAEFDHIISFSEGRALFDASPAVDKTFLKIPGANHNDVFYRGMEDYLKAVVSLAQKTGATA